MNRTSFSYTLEGCRYHWEWHQDGTLPESLYEDGMCRGGIGWIGRGGNFHKSKL